MAGRTGRPLIRKNAFWDTSALVPLFVGQPLSPMIEMLYKRYGVVVWWAAPVEIASAMARLVRMKQLSTRDWADARRFVVDLAAEWRVIEPSDALRDEASRLVDRYHLRAADALQLAAALEWRKGAPQGDVFLVADERLKEAAMLTGFDTQLI